MNNKAPRARTLSRRVWLENFGMGVTALALLPMSLSGCGDGVQLEPSIADGKIAGTALDGAAVALTAITQNENPSEPVIGRVVLNDKVLPVRVNVSDDIQQAFRFVSTNNNESIYQSTFLDSSLQPYSVETTVTELIDGFLVKVSTGSTSATLTIPKSLVPALASDKPTSIRENPAGGSAVLLWIVIVLAASWLIAQLIDLAKMALCLAEGGTIYTSTVGVVNSPQEQQWGVTSLCQKATGGSSPR